MSVDILNGFTSLAEYAEVVEADPEKSRRIVEKEAEIEQFLVSEGLAEVYRPKQDVKRFRGEQVGQAYNDYLEHLSGVAEEALRVGGNEFFYATRTSVIRALRVKMVRGEDPRLIPSYRDATLMRHIFMAGVKLDYAFPTFQSQELRTPLTRLVNQEDFIDIIKSPGWRHTFEHVASVLPNGVDATEVRFLLMNFAEPGSRVVEDRLTKVRTKLGRKIA